MDPAPSEWFFQENDLISLARRALGEAGVIPGASLTFQAHIFIDANGIPHIGLRVERVWTEDDVLTFA